MKGFLPKEPPLREYQKSSPSLDRLQEIAHNLPKLLLTSQVQPTVESLTKNDLSIQEILDSNSEREIRLAMVHLSFISHVHRSWFFIHHSSNFYSRLAKNNRSGQNSDCELFHRFTFV